MKNVTSYIKTHKNRFVNELIELLKIPSVSADSAHNQDVLNTADFVKRSLEKAGCDKVELCETPGYPIIYAEKIIDKNLPYADPEAGLSAGNIQGYQSGAPAGVKEIGVNLNVKL